jgi:hypothetical protein
LPGNEEQIPLYVYVLISPSFDEFFFSSAYELYAHLSPRKESPPQSDSSKEENGSEQRQTKSQKKADQSSMMAKRFKDTFSRPKVKVHFIGVWCVSDNCRVHASLTIFWIGIPSLLSG